MSEQTDKKVIDILTDINTNVGDIRENMIRMESRVGRHDEKISDIQADLKAEGLPTRVSHYEADPHNKADSEISMKRKTKIKTTAGAMLLAAVPAVVMLTSSSPAAPIEPTWTLIQLVGYDADGETVTMPLAYHPYTFLDLIDLPGDANADGIVNIEDLNLVLTNFGRTR